MSHDIIAVKNNPISVEYDEWDIISRISWASSKPKPETEIYSLLGYADKNMGTSGDGSEVEFTHEEIKKAIERTTIDSPVGLITFLNECFKASEKGPVWICFW